MGLEGAGWKLCVLKACTAFASSQLCPTPRCIWNSSVCQDACRDTAHGALDLRGNDCGFYLGAKDRCGSYDDPNFTSTEMCCSCGGGTVLPPPLASTTTIIPSPLDTNESL